MTDQNFQSDSHKDNAADELGPETAAEATAKTNAKEVARETEEERNQPDDDQWKGKAAERAVARKGECYAYSQRVNARCDGQKELRFQAHGVEMLCFFGQKRLANHASTDESQQPEGYPMVVGFDVTAEMCCAHPAQQWHDCLEKAEQKGHAENGKPQPLAQDNAADDGYREAIHGQSDGQQRQIDEVHHGCKGNVIL